MDHSEIQERGLVELYHRGLLPPDEEALFEEHFVGCPECQEQLVYARGFQKGLKTLAAEDAARTVVQAGLLAWLARRGRLAGLLAAVLVLAALLPAFWLAARNRDLRASAAEARTWQQRWEEERKSAEDLRRQLAESRRRPKPDDRIATATPTPPAPRQEGLANPLFNTPVFLLTIARDGEPAVLDLAKQPGPIALAVDAGDDPRFESYRVTITAAGGRRLFRQGGLRPNVLEALMVTFPEGFFAAGDYRLEVEGLKPDSGAEAVGGYAFRVVR
ncbi:MAG TPA: zf-HC2 domain-containing protein [Thermoanaerobaculia bacterium]